MLLCDRIDNPGYCLGLYPTDDTVIVKKIMGGIVDGAIIKEI
jgi:hypothetical protein